ncbi:phosphotransferase, partial [Paenibacillus sepulcri]|nr:phosphotransferase [Paenibacillus sepulcri]
MGKEHEAAVAELLDQYKFPAPWRAVLEESGMNNTTRMVYAGADKYIMRIYNNHRDPDIVRLEHHVLHELQSAELPYLVPRPVPNERLETVTMTEDGKLGALYHYIEGERPTVHNNHHVEELGRAAGLLILALRQSAIAERPLYKPYYEFEETHGAMTDEHIIVLTERSPVLRGRAGELETMAGLRRRLRELRPLFSGLPQQWIHGDIGFTNALARNE